MERKKKFFRKKRGVASSVFSWLLVFAMVISNVSVSPGLLLTVQAAESEVGTESTGETQEMDGVGSGETAQTTEGSGGEEDVQPAENGGTGETTDAGGSTESGTAGTEEVTTPETSVETDEAGTTEESSQIPETDTAEETAGTEETLTEETEETATAEETTETETVEEAETVDDIVNDGALSETVTVTIHFKDTVGWGGQLNVHHWVEGTADAGTAWPGESVTQKDEDGNYVISIEKKRADLEKEGAFFGFIFNNKANGNDGTSPQAENATISGTFLSQCDTYEIWVQLTQYNNKYYAQISPSATVRRDGSKVTFSYGNDGASSVYLAGTMNGWSSNADQMVKGDDGLFTLEKNLSHGDTQYKFVVNYSSGGQDWVVDPASPQILTEESGNQNGLIYVPEDKEYTYTVHYYNRDKADLEVGIPDLHVWELDASSQEAKQHKFTEKTEIDGIPWLTTTFSIACRNIGLIGRPGGDWDSDQDADQSYRLVNGESAELWYVHGLGVFDKKPNLGGVEKVTASLQNTSMDYTQNNVLTLILNDDENTKVMIEEAYVDASDLGISDKLMIDPELLAVSLSVTQDTAPGEYSLPVTVVDSSGHEVKTSAAVTVVEKAETKDDFDWDEAVIYFMVTDRFFDGDSSNNGANGPETYKENPTGKEGAGLYHGGDFKGVTEKLDYLQDLGVNTIWITPIVENVKGVTVGDGTGEVPYYAGYHGYWASDFTKINPALGTEEEFQALIDAAHAKGMKIMVDVVVNHAGYGMEDSQTFDGMLRDSVVESDFQLGGGQAGLPDFMTEIPEVRDQIIAWQLNWAKKGVDYFRVDTVKHVDSTTWMAFKNELTKANPRFKMIGEYFGAGYASENGGTLGSGQMDSLLDFNFNDWAKSFVSGSIQSVEADLAKRNGALNNTYLTGQFLSSHDEIGFKQSLNGVAAVTDKEGAALVAATLQITAKGQPVIYYGEEIGLTGDNDYPYQTNRYDFDWTQTETGADNKTLAHYKTMLGIRNQYSELFARGGRSVVKNSDTEGYDVIARTYNGENVYVGMNIKSDAKEIVIPVDGNGITHYKDLYGDPEGNTPYAVSKNQNESTVTVTIPAAADGGTVVLVASAYEETLVAPELMVAKGTDEKGKTSALPLQLTYIATDGKRSLVDVSYSMDAVEGVTLDGENKKVTVNNAFAGTEITLTATAQVNTGSLSTTFTVKVVEDKNEITLRLHYTRPGKDYEGWNVWAWKAGQDGARYDFEENGTQGDKIVTFTLEGRKDSVLNYIIRLSKAGEEWADKDIGADRFVDLSDVLSGTVDYWVDSGVFAGRRVLGDDVLLGVKVRSAAYNRKNNTVKVSTGMPVVGKLDDAFILKCADGTTVPVAKVTANKTDYTLSLGADLSTLEAMAKEYTIVFDGYDYKVAMPSIYSSEEFEEQYTYEGDDLGAVWTKEKTTFKVWAPTADQVEVCLYEAGEVKEDAADQDSPIKTLPMTKGEKGVWSVEEAGDLNGTYYTYKVTVDGETTEACDPYARTTGVNGNRAMVIDLASTNPEGWANDIGPNQGMSYTDSVIYELHVRDFSIDENSGISAENKGKFLGLTEKGTTNKSGQPTGLDYLTDLGITHIHLLPSYDYATVDETKLDTAQYNWGYDPKNYNVPEGSYATDPYNGSVRVKEMKQMVKTLHDNNINVIMDVVYNHVYDADKFCFNQLVPKYFSRTNADGSYSSGSGCGNDTASERSMVKKYIVDSVNYWADEYHIDGFRFDLVGLLDTETINEVVNTVHQKHPDVVFYGEGWSMSTAVSKDGYTMATQANSAKTPGFAYFSDTIRDAIKGDNFEAEHTGFVSGAPGKEATIAACFMAAPAWCKSPTQTVNYASCHDNYTLWDKLQSSRPDLATGNVSDLIKMNNLSAAIYMMSEGIPLIHAGEEILRTKVDENDNLIHNSYNSSDFVNSIKWADLDKAEYRAVRDYYKGLIEFRKNHAALRLTSAADVTANVKYHWITNEVLMFVINGKESVQGEVSDGIIVIFNANTTSRTVDLTKAGYGVPQGTWNVCIDDQKAGIETLRSITDGQVEVAPISAMVLVKGETKDDDSVYDKNELLQRKLQALKDLITKYEGLEQGNYTEESFAVFEAALDEAKKTAAAPDATVDQIDLAKSNLQAAIDGLKLQGGTEPADKEALEALVKEYQKITEQGNYTDESWTAFKDALAEAERVLADQNATQSEIEKAVSGLKSAYDGLAEYREGLWTSFTEDSGLTLGDDGKYHIDYTGKAIKPGIRVYDGRMLLKEKTDYTVAYKKNTDAGEALITVKGKGNYSEYLEVNFTIDRIEIGDLEIADLYAAIAATNTKQIALKPVVKYNGKALKLNRDYTVAYANPETDGKTPGVYTVKIEAGKNLTKNKNFTGGKEISMRLVDKATVKLMSKASIQKIPAQAYEWDNTLRHGKVQTPEVIVKHSGATLIQKDAADPDKKWDYEVIYDTVHTEAGDTATVTVRGNGTTYVGEKTTTFKITGTALKANKVSLKDVPKAGYVYSGTDYEPEVIVDIEQKDYEQYSVEYQKNRDAGTAIVLVKGKNGYTGTVKKTFKITPYDIKTNEGSNFLFGENNAITEKIPYAKGGSKLTDGQVGARFNYTEGETQHIITLEQGKDYTVSYKNNKRVSTETAKAEITIKGKGNFKGTVNKIPFDVVQQDLSVLAENATAGDIVVKNAAKYNKVMPTIKDLDGKALKNQTDYTIDKETAYTYVSEDPAVNGTPVTGTPAEGSVIKVTAKATDKNYKGEVSAIFRVIADDKNLSALKITIAEQQYTGKEVKLGVEDFTFQQKVGGRWVPLTMTEQDFEIVSYSNNLKKGTAKVTLHGLSEYGGTKTVTFKIKARPMK